MKITFDTRDKISSSVVVGEQVAVFGIVRDVTYSDTRDVISIKWESLCITNKLEIERFFLSYQFFFIVISFFIGFAAALITKS